MIPGSLNEVRNRFDMTSRKRTAPRIQKKIVKYKLILKILSNHLNNVLPPISRFSLSFHATETDVKVLRAREE